MSTKEQSPQGAASWVGGASRKAPQVPDQGRRTAAPARRDCPDPRWREPREQAYVPAEQPPSPQGARLPPAHAHPCRPRNSVLAPPQGSQESRRLTAGSPPALRDGLVLPAAHRLTDGATFREAIRSGRRAGGRTLVVHLWVDDAGSDAGDRSARVGFVVSKAVGNAVVRNQVKRRLRHLAREHVSTLPGSAVLVVRALPPSAGARSAELRADLERCLQRTRPEVSR